MTGASGFSIQARIKVLLSPQRSEAQLVSMPIIFLGVKWVLRECSSNINCSRVTIHAKKTCRDSGGKSPLHSYFSWWKAERFEMFRNSEKYVAPSGIRTSNLSNHILVIIPTELPRTVTHKNRTKHLIKYGVPRQESVYAFKPLNIDANERRCRAIGRTL